jgi:hypothetical protein
MLSPTQGSKKRWRRPTTEGKEEKAAAQDSTKPQRSSTTEGHGVSYQTLDDHHATGEKALDLTRYQKSKTNSIKSADWYNPGSPFAAQIRLPREKEQSLLNSIGDPTRLSNESSEVGGQMGGARVGSLAGATLGGGLGLESVLKRRTPLIQATAETTPKALKALAKMKGSRWGTAAKLALPFLGGGYLGGMAGGAIGAPTGRSTMESYGPTFPQGGGHYKPSADSFTDGFLRVCAQRGVDPSSLISTVAREFSKEAADELREGIEKRAGVPQWLQKAWQFGRGAFGGGGGPMQAAGKSVGGLMNPRNAQIASQFMSPAERGLQSANQWGRGFGKGVAPSAFGGLAGYFAGDDLGVGGVPGAMAGAAAFNPYLRKSMMRNMGANATNFAIKPVTHSIAGGFGGSAVDMAAGGLGYDTGGGFGRLGAFGGLATGAGQAGLKAYNRNAMRGARQMRNPLHGAAQPMSDAGRAEAGLASQAQSARNAEGGMGMKAPLSEEARIGAGQINPGNMAGRGTNALGKAQQGAHGFTQGAFDPLMSAVTYPFRAAGNYIGGKGGTRFFGDPARSGAQRAGRVVGGIGLGAGAAGMGYNALNNQVNQKAVEMYDNFRDQAGHDIRGAINNYGHDFAQKGLKYGGGLATGAGVATGNPFLMAGGAGALYGSHLMNHPGMGHTPGMPLGQQHIPGMPIGQPHQPGQGWM